MYALFSMPAMIAVPSPLTLDDFLRRPDIDESPAWEYIDGEAVQKIMPGGKHSRLQWRFADAINSLEGSYEAFPELRCTFGGRSIVPDIAILARNQVPTDENGEIVSTGIKFAPSWMVEILSPNQSSIKVTRKILHGLRHGCQLGTLIDPTERVVLAYRADRIPDELTKLDVIPCLDDIQLTITVQQLFDWLKVR